MKIGCLQFAPVKGDVLHNLSRADAVLLKETPEHLDLLVLPKLAFTGSHFKSRHEIRPFLEPTGSGPSSLWARTAAIRYDCTVVSGYPEKASISEYHNSAIIINDEGQTSSCCHESRRNAMDFYMADVAGVGYATVGVSMDTSPHRSRAPCYTFQFAEYVLQMQSNLVIVLLACPTSQDGRYFSGSPQEPDMETLMDWVSQLEPLIRRKSNEEIIVVFSNRTGSDGGIFYAGTSAILGIKDGEVDVYGILGRGDRKLLVVDTEKEAYGKLVYRPKVGCSAPALTPKVHERLSVLDRNTAVPTLWSDVLLPPPQPTFRRKSGKSSIQHQAVAHTNGSAGTPRSTLTTGPESHPKLTLTTSSDLLEPPQTDLNGITPGGLSPTPFSQRPRISIPPVESWTQRYLESYMVSPTPYMADVMLSKA